MSAVPRAKLTPMEYLAIERKAECRRAFFDGEMFSLAGASREHVMARDNRCGQGAVGGDLS